MELGTWATPEVESAKAKADICSRPIDLVHLARYTLGNRALEREVLEMFLRQSAIYLQKLKAGASEGKAWIEATHTIKGSARAVGAWRVAACADLAERVGEADAMRRSDSILLLELEINRANLYIETLFAEG